MAKAQPPSFLKDIGQDVVTVHVGPDKTPFLVHKDLLTTSSPYFKAAFEGEFREATDKTILLEDISVIQFKLFLDWLYFGRLTEARIKRGECACCETSGLNCRAVCHRDPAAGRLHAFKQLSEEEDTRLEAIIADGSWNSIKLYIFADRYDVPSLRKAIIDKSWSTWISMCRLNLSATILALRNLPYKSEMCRLLIDSYTESWKFRYDMSCDNDVLLQQKLPAEFLFHVSNGLARLDSVPGQRIKVIKNLCAYHEHPQDEESIKACPGADKIRK
ncbi:hypothetical protein FKW77_004298 [Venturia effusa]|uniref:BTB domain-containing protein n=1 Tax=Venturia effusa TaxID=50376 RepID=A0A517LLB1_9PEZI|nr:hypothetical protein FKW77_004298 [Venturia effusa]